MTDFFEFFTEIVKMKSGGFFMAIASLVLGLISLLGCVAGGPGVVCGILAIIFGVIGRKDSKNRGMATAGLVLGILAIFGGLIVLLLLGGAILGAAAFL